MPASDQHTKTLEAAEVVRKLVEGDNLLDQMREAFKVIDSLPSPPLSPGVVWYDCNCPPYGTCMNTACPRRVRITC